MATKTRASKAPATVDVALELMAEELEAQEAHLDSIAEEVQTILPMVQDKAPETVTPKAVVQDVESFTLTYAGLTLDLHLDGDGFFLFPAGTRDPSTGEVRTEDELRPGMGVVKRIVVKTYEDGTQDAVIVVQSKGLNQWGRPKLPIPFRFKGGTLSIIPREETQRMQMESPILVQRRVDQARQAKTQQQQTTAS